MKISWMYIIFAVLGVVLILGASLLTTSNLISFGASDSLTSSNRKLYVRREVLPDHVLYPVVMLKENILVKLASDSERSDLYQQYARKRLRAAYSLAQTQETKALALSTLTKGQKYLLKHCIMTQLSLEPKPDMLEVQTDIYAYVRDAQVVIKTLDLPDTTSASQLQIELAQCSKELR